MKNQGEQTMKTNRNFTLVELLIVVAIIAILASMLLPALSKALERSRSVQCTANLKTLGMTHQEYAAISDDFLMPVKWDSIDYNEHPDGSSYHGRGSYWNGFTVLMMKVPFKTIYCPTMAVMDHKTGSTSIAVIGKTVKAYPPRSGTWESLGYGKNKTAGGHNHHPKIARMSQTVHPSSSILLGESDGVGKSMSYALSYQSSETSCQLYPYHDGVTNLLWVDGHTSGVQVYTKDLIYGRLDGYHGYQAVPLNSKWIIFPFQ